MAASYAKLFEPVTGTQVGKALRLMKPKMFINALLSNRPILVIDLRTPNESGVVGMTLSGSQAIPVKEMFLQKSLKLIPHDKTVVIVCITGALRF